MRRSALALCCVLMPIAACGTDTTTAADVPPDPTTTTGAASATTAGVVPIEVPPCDLLTPDEVASATGLEVEAVIDEPPITCVFDLGADAGVDVFVDADDGMGRLDGPAAVFEGYAEIVADGEAEEIADLGDAALYAARYRGLVVDAGGGRFIGVGVNGGFQQLQEPRDALIELAALMLGRLDG